MSVRKLLATGTGIAAFVLSAGAGLSGASPIEGDAGAAGSTASATTLDSSLGTPILQLNRQNAFCIIHNDHGGCLGAGVLDQVGAGVGDGLTGGIVTGCVGGAFFEGAGCVPGAVTGGVLGGIWGGVTNPIKNL